MCVCDYGNNVASNMRMERVTYEEQKEPEPGKKKRSRDLWPDDGQDTRTDGDDSLPLMTSPLGPQVVICRDEDGEDVWPWLAWKDQP